MRDIIRSILSFFVCTPLHPNISIHILCTGTGKENLCENQKLLEFIFLFSPLTFNSRVILQGEIRKRHS